MDDYLTSFIVNASKVKFTTGDGRRWQMRQPTPEEAADGDSAYRLAYNRIKNDKRLGGLAEDKNSLEHEARIRGAAAEVAYMLPLLLEKEDSTPAFDIYSPVSLEEFETTDAAIIKEMSEAYWKMIQAAISQAKKKSP